MLKHKEVILPLFVSRKNSMTKGPKDKARYVFAGKIKLIALASNLVWFVT